LLLADTGIWHNIRKGLKRWEYWVGVLGLIVTILLALLIIVNRDVVEQLSAYGYAGLLLVSTLGGATVLIPVPMLAVQFAMGGVLEPWIGPPALAPLFVGLVSGFGETLGALTIYMTGYGSGTPFKTRQMEEGEKGWFTRNYIRIMKLMERRGGLTIFVISAVINPFFYPVSLAAGAVRFGIKKYFLIAFAGKTVKCTAIAYAGYFGVRGIFTTLGIDL
jgi:membrane protein YqaA with SNARE-associated domain